MKLGVMNFEFHSPIFLWLFILFLPLLWQDLRTPKRKGIPVPTVTSMRRNSAISRVLFFLKLTKYLVLTALVLAMARPRTYEVSVDPDDEKGIDIILAVDVSLSMLARDLNPDRLTSLKGIAQDFVDKRENDRVGLVIYSGEAFTKVPVTSDHQIVLDELSQLNPFEIQSGTAIGEGLSVSVNHLKDSKAKSKIIILMTDGVDTIENAMDPQTAAQLAKSFGIKVYSIGIGSNGFALMPTQMDIFGDLVFTETKVTLDESVLKEIASTTGGRYFRATSNDSLSQIYEEINRLEKSEVRSTKTYSYEEYFSYLLGFALIVLCVDAVLRWRWFRILN